MKPSAFDTPLVLSGPFRTPRQMLGSQEYGGHESIHDDAMAQKLGFRGGPIEGPTHFSQFVPLLSGIWGQSWFETGCLSAHYQNVCVEGEEVKAFVEFPGEGQNQARIWMEKKDGSPVLKGTASVGPDHPETELEKRLRTLRPINKLVILRDLEVGASGVEDEQVRMDFDKHMGALYPFTLEDKLKTITESTTWYTREGGGDSPWGRPIVPLEMASVLTQYTANRARFKVAEPSVGLFADQEIRMIKGPLFVGREYVLDREIVALSEGRRTESYWVKTHVRDPESREVLAVALLNQAVLKESYPGYEEAAKK